MIVIGTSETLAQVEENLINFSFKVMGINVLLISVLQEFNQPELVLLEINKTKWSMMPLLVKLNNW